VRPPECANIANLLPGMRQQDVPRRRGYTMARMHSMCRDASSFFPHRDLSVAGSSNFEGPRAGSWVKADLGTNPTPAENQGDAQPAHGRDLFMEKKLGNQGEQHVSQRSSGQT